LLLVSPVIKELCLSVFVVLAAFEMAYVMTDHVCINMCIIFRKTFTEISARLNLHLDLKERKPHPQRHKICQKVIPPLGVIMATKERKMTVSNRCSEKSDRVCWKHTGEGVGFMYVGS